MSNDTIVLERDRSPNAVDVLLKEVARIQAVCEHDFRLTTEVTLKESDVTGVYITYDASDHRPSSVVTIIVKCLKCSYERNLKAGECLKCLGHVTEGELERRKAYFGDSYMYYAARLSQCDRCGFKMVHDEWNQ